jgi:phosphonate transport system substrate-binding protein
MRLFATTALILLAAVPAFAQDWKADYKTVKFGILSGENEQDRLARWKGFETHLEMTLGVDVEIFTAGNYDGVIQALAADQIEFAYLGSSAYAAAYTASEGGVQPILATESLTGATGYYSIVTVRCDSGYKTIDDLKGKVLAFADPDSTSGYAVPLYNLVQQGYDPETFFAGVPFSGSHEAGVQGVVNKQFDAAATYRDNETSGVYQLMVTKGMIKEGEVCVIWQSPEITNGPITTRNNLPQPMIDEVKAALMALPTAAPEVYKEITGGETSTDKGYIEVNHERYQWIIDMRAWIKANRKS